MQAALYFPFINVPPTAWWTRTLLYWDRVGTIVPRSYWHDPDRLGRFTLELVREGLVDQFRPEWAGRSLGDNFARYLDRLGAEEIDERRRRLRNGQVVFVHRDKWLMYASGLREVRQMGLALGGDHFMHRGDEWVALEQLTANEFMAALTLALCQRASAAGEGSGRGAMPTGTWVPTTDLVEAVQVMLSGLEPKAACGESRKMNLRVRGEVAAAEIRTELLSELLPVPTTPLDVNQIVAFRRRHGDLLPNLRRHLESKIDEALTVEDEVLRFRLLDRIRDELEDRIAEAEAYLRELPLKSVSRSSILKLLKFVPFLKDPIEAGQDAAESFRSNPNFESEPLAYLAFARATFASARRFTPKQEGDVPFVEAISGMA
ncbi:hypothetical protein GA0070606_5486 [Micromonospora citrea]|uniref:Uncharacterized protein n=1 Tax=Micromonospora citrea TaxID=47855 RepID=A0A1C6VWI1_9ACTN|nr:hypothetical protein [Micromonospora citrea]SCL70708.1 hypothetical protein GA0070606_5486 [Micromonospora citrea]